MEAASRSDPASALLKKIQSTSQLSSESSSIVNNSASEFRNTLSQKIKNILGDPESNPSEKLEASSSSVSAKRFAGAFALSSATSSKSTSDLEKYFLGSNFPAEALNFVVELKNSVEAESSGDNDGIKNKNLILNLIKKLFQAWISSNSLAEAFIRYSIQPASLAETANFSRNLFSVPTNFSQDFPSFISHQLLLAVSTLSELIRQNDENAEIRSQFLSSTLDRLYLRFHTDQEHFYPYFEAQDEGDFDLQDRITQSALNELVTKDPFVKWIMEATELVKKDFVARRLIGKILLGLGANQINKVARGVILTEAFCSCPATKLFYPPEEFLYGKSEPWKRVLLISVPLKTRLNNFPFFSTWSAFLLYSNENRAPADLFEIWKSLCTSWSQIINNSYADLKTVLSSSCALICLCKAVKNSSQFQSFTTANASDPSAVVPIFQGVQNCLGSTDQRKQACGMAVGQVIADLINLNNTQSPSKPPPLQKTEGEILAQEILQPPTDPSISTDTTCRPTNLKFDSENPLFLQFIQFYEQADYSESTLLEVPVKKLKSQLKIVPRNLCAGLMNPLDSDDDEEPMAVDEDDEAQEEADLSDRVPFKPYDMSNDTPVSETLLNLRDTSKKIPVYFSDICEILLEADGSSKDEATVESLKQIAIMKIPVLLRHKIRIDPTMRKDLTRALAELDSGGLLEIPIICGLYEMSSLHPIEVFQTLSQLAFDREHYSAGQRMVILARFTEVAQLLSKQKCFSCFSEKTGRLDRLLEKIHPPFMRDYLLVKRGQRKCSSCDKADGGKTTKTAGSKATIKPKEGSLGSPVATAAENKDPAPALALPWREVIERRLAAKTRRFGASKPKPVESVDIYSAKLVPIIWASIANKLMDQGNLNLLLNSKHSDSLSFALFTAQAFRSLGMMVLGTSGIYCPHLRNIAVQTADLVSVYSHHSDAQVRRSVLSLLATIIASSESKQFILEIFLNSSGNLLEELKVIYEKDPDGENRHLFATLLQLLTASAVVQFGNVLK